LLDARAAVCETARIVVYVVVSVAVVNVLAVVVVARLGRRLSGTTDERLARPAGDAAPRRAPRMRYRAPDRGVTGSGLEQQRELREAGELTGSVADEQPVAERIS
jgi:hypothetical protein